MVPDVLELLKHRLARLREEHGRSLVFQDSETLRTIDLARKTTISTAYEKLLQDTFTTLAEYCRQLRNEVLTAVDETVTESSTNDQISIISLATAQFEHDIYLKRFDLFGESVARHFGRRSITIDISAYRLDLYKARHHAGTADAITCFLSSLNDDIELIMQRKRRETVEQNRQTKKHLHWTTSWGFWITVIGTIAGVGGTYRALVPAPASNSMPTTPDANPAKSVTAVPSATSSSAQYRISLLQSHRPPKMLHRALRM